MRMTRPKNILREIDGTIGVLMVGSMPQGLIIIVLVCVGVNFVAFGNLVNSKLTGGYPQQALHPTANQSIAD